MNSEVSQEVLSRIDILASKLETTGAHLWGVLVGQATIDAVIHSLISVLMLTAVILMFALARRIWLAGGYDKEPGTYFAVAAGLVFVLFFFLSFHAALTATFNPEYRALMKLISAIGGE